MPMTVEMKTTRKFGWDGQKSLALSVKAAGTQVARSKTSLGAFSASSQLPFSVSVLYSPESLLLTSVCCVSLLASPSCDRRPRDVVMAE